MRINIFMFTIPTSNDRTANPENAQIRYPMDSIYKPLAVIQYHNASMVMAQREGDHLHNPSSRSYNHAYSLTGKRHGKTGKRYIKKMVYLYPPHPVYTALLAWYEFSWVPISKSGVGFRHVKTLHGGV